MFFCCCCCFFWGEFALFLLLFVFLVWVKRPRLLSVLLDHIWAFAVLFFAVFVCVCWFVCVLLCVLIWMCLLEYSPLFKVGFDVYDVFCPDIYGWPTLTLNVNYLTYTHTHMRTHTQMGTHTCIMKVTYLIPQYAIVACNTKSLSGRSS